MRRKFGSFAAEAAPGNITEGINSIESIKGGYFTGKEIILAGGTTSVLRSEGYIPGSAGLAMFGDGSAEFSDVTIRGTVYATAGELGALTIVDTISSEVLTQPNWEQYLNHDGSNTTRIDTPDTATTSITGDIDLAVLIDPTDWTPGTGTGGSTIAYGTQTDNLTGSGTSHSIALSGTTNGFVVVVLVTNSNTSTTFSNPDGTWTTVPSASISNASGSVHIAYKLYSGAMSTPVSFGTGTSVALQYQTYTWTGVGSVSVTGTSTTATNGAVDPPSHTAAESVTSAADVWFACGAGRDTGGTSPSASTPAGYTGRDNRVGTYYGMAGASRAGTDSATENPGAVTSASMEVWAAATFALFATDAVPADTTWANKWNTGTNQRSYRIGLDSDGKIVGHWSADGSTELATRSSAATGFSTGTKKWIRWTMDVDNGAGSRVTKFYTSAVTSTTDHTPASWSQLGSTDTTSGTTSIYDSSARLMVGGHTDGSAQQPIGKSYGLLLNNAYDSSLYSAADIKLLYGLSNPTAPLVGWPISNTTSGVSETGETWTLRGTVQPTMTIAEMLAAGVGFTINGQTGRESFNTLIAFVQWKETATAVTASYANAISKTLTLPFSGETCIIELSCSARGTDLGENETIFITPRITVNGVDYDGDEISDSNPNATGGQGSLVVGGSGYHSSTTPAFTAIGHSSLYHSLTGSPSVTLADKHYTLHDIPFAVGPIYVTGSTITVALRTKGTTYTGTPRFRMVARVTRAWS